MNEDNIVVLTDENGDDVRFEFLDLITYANEEYIVLLPEEESDENTEVVILKVEDDEDGMETFGSVEDETTLQAVFEIFRAKFADEFNFVD